MFSYETIACKISTSFNFWGKERSFHIVNRPIIVIKPKTSYKCDFVTEVFSVAKFSVYGISSYLECADLWKYLYLGGEDLKIC